MGALPSNGGCLRGLPQKQFEISGSEKCRSDREENSFIALEFTTLIKWLLPEIFKFGV